METPFAWGNEHQKVLADRDHHGLAYNIGGTSHEHTMASMLVGVDGLGQNIQVSVYHF